MKIISFSILLFPFFSLFAQAPGTIASGYAATIEAKTLREHVYQLASKAFEGRETGTVGNNKAAKYIAQQFALDGIPPIPGDGDYFQELAFSRIQWKTDQLSINGNIEGNQKDYLSIPQYFPDSVASLRIESLTFLGYGIDDPAYSDYTGKNMKGQNIIVFSGEPRNQDGNFRITGTDSASTWTSNPLRKIAAAKSAGAASIWIIEDDFKDFLNDTRRNYLNERMLMGSAEILSAAYIHHAFISSSLGDQILGKKKNKIMKLRKRMAQTGKTVSLEIPVDIRWKVVKQIKSLVSQNVLGYIEGTDPRLKDELVVVSAHYDHLGKRGEEIYFGADDNASGTSAVLEIAQAMEQAKIKGDGPRRSVLCMLVTGEEKGLLGSQYYSEHPVFPLANTVADVNIDMIGRVDTLHKNSNYTYVIGSDRLSTDLHKINEAMNMEYTHLDLDYTYNADDDPNRFYYRSDHYNFAKNGIPAIFFFSGVHADYHRPTDTPDKIMYDKAQTIAQLAFYTAWELANREERIRVDVVGRN
ncbi:MAG: M28 family peptidase [Saprospiraceae bacterium]